MSETPIKLAEAEAAWRWRTEHPSGFPRLQVRQLRALLAEYNRRGKIEAAATALVAWWSDGGVCDERLDRLLDALAAEVGGEQR
jgi:hypothetical protein